VVVVPSLKLRGQQRLAFRQLPVSPVASVDRRRGLRRRALAVPPHAQGPRAQLVGDAGGARPAHAGDERRLQSRAPSHVFGVLAVGVGAGAAAAELDRGTGGAGWFVDVVLFLAWAGGGAGWRSRSAPA